MTIDWCEECGAALPEGRAGCCDECIAAADRIYDEEQERIEAERWELLTDTLRKAYPTRIPEYWLR